MIQRKIAIAAAECYALDSAVMVAAGMVDRGGIDFSLETAACKVFGSELAFRAANDALQIAGGIGYSKEYPYEQAVRDSRINLIFEGTNEILRALIALMGLQQPGERLKALGKAFKDPIHSLGAIGEYIAGRAKRHDHEAAVHARARGARATKRSSSRRWCTISRSASKARSCSTARGSSTSSSFRSAWRTRRSTSSSRRRCSRARRGRSSARVAAAALPRRADRLRADLRADGVSPRAPVDPRAAPKSGRSAQGDRRAFDRNRRAGTRGARRRTVKARAPRSSIFRSAFSVNDGLHPRVDAALIERRARLHDVVGIRAARQNEVVVVAGRQERQALRHGRQMKQAIDLGDETAAEMRDLGERVDLAALVHRGERESNLRVHL